MGKNKKPKCVMILTEGPSDRFALSSFFTELYSYIDEDIEVLFPTLREEYISESGDVLSQYNGDITSRNGITPDNILPMLLKLFIHPELKKHPEYEYPSSVHEIIHLIDIDGVFLDDERIVNADQNDTRKLPYYDDKNHNVIVRDRESIIQIHQRKRANIEKLVETKRLRITIAKDENQSREKPYRVFFFSSNLDHVLFGKANNESFNKVNDARSFSSSFYYDQLKMASYFLNHPCAAVEKNYRDSWNALYESYYSLEAHTNINILVEDLLKKAGIKELPVNDVRPYNT